MKDKSTIIGDENIKPLNELDRLISSASSQVRLPSNFSHLVMQKIIKLKVERARTSAAFQSGLIALLSLVLGLGMLFIYTEFYDSQNNFVSTLKGIQSLVLPVLSSFVLVALVMLDAFFSSRKLRSPQQFLK